MRYITEQELRRLFAKGIPQEYALPRDAKLTPAARQYLTDLRLYRPEGGRQGRPAPSSSGPKPEHMTHLTPDELVPKTHPRIALRGRLDSLQADILWAQAAAAERGAGELVPALEDALSLARRVLAAEVTGKPLGEWLLGGMTPAQVRASSHRPQDFGFLSHVLPSAAQGMMAALLNRLRTQARETELAAAAAFCWEGAPCGREDLLLALNRLSSYFYLLELKTVKGKEG